MFRDFWNILQEYNEPEDKEMYWENLVEETTRFYDTYKTEFAKELILALNNDIEKKWRKKHERRKVEES